MKSADWKLNTEVQYTTRATPRQNSQVDKKFDTLTSRGVSMMNAANLKRKERCKLFKKAFTTAAMLDGLTVITRNGVAQTRYEHWNGELPKYLANI